MKRLTTLTLALIAAGGLTLAGCDKRDDMPPTSAGPGTTTTPSDTTPGTTTTPAPTDTTPTSPAMPPASAASQ
ncbi:MAG TPA: hypothetical protein VGD46_03095 [Rhizobacter sp.]